MNPPVLDLYNPFDAEFRDNPYPQYTKIREQAPIHKSGSLGCMIVASYDAVRSILKDKNFQIGFDYKSKAAASGQDLSSEPAFAQMQHWLLKKDPPDHTKLRKSMGKAFDARSITKIKDDIEQIVNKLIDQVIDRREMEIISEFSKPIPFIVICSVLGLDDEQTEDLMYNHEIPTRIVDPTPMSPEELETANRNTLALKKFFKEQIEIRQRDPQDDLLTGLIEAQTEEGELKLEELLANIMMLFAAGYETTMNLMGNGLLALYQNPEQLALLKSQPELAMSAANEFIRFDSSVQLITRKPVRDTQFGEFTFKEGENVLLLLASGNRDPKQFEWPDKLNIERKSNNHLGFGGGIHRCLGAQLAQVEISCSVNTLLQRLPNLKLHIEDVSWKKTIALRGLESLHATW